VLSIAIVVIYWNAWSNVALQFAAMPFFLLAGWSIARSAHPNRPRFRVRNAALILGLASVGMVLSAIGTYGAASPFPSGGRESLSRRRWSVSRRTARRECS
jgi:hypothetical protein